MQLRKPAPFQVFPFAGLVQPLYSVLPRQETGGYLGEEERPTAEGTDWGGRETEEEQYGP